jgi:hypothetical protein
MGHLAGFTSDFAGFASHLGTAAGLQIFVAPDSTTALISGGEHLDSRQYPNDLMGTELSPSIRRLPSPVDVQILSIARGITPPPSRFSLDALGGTNSTGRPVNQQSAWTTVSSGSVVDITSQGSGSSQTVSPGLGQWVNPIPSGAVGNLPSRDGNVVHSLLIGDPSPDHSGGFALSSQTANRASSAGVGTRIDAMAQASFAVITGALGSDPATSAPKSSSISNPSSAALHGLSLAPESLVLQAGEERPAPTGFMGEICFISDNIDKGRDGHIGSSDPRPARVPAEPTPETDPVRAEDATGNAPEPELPLVSFRIDVAPVVEPPTPPATWESALDEALLDATLVKSREEESDIRSSNSPVITALALALAGEAARGILLDRGDASLCESGPADAGEQSSYRGGVRRLAGGWLKRLWSSIRKIRRQPVDDLQ